MKTIRFNILLILQFISLVVFAQIQDGLYADNNRKIFLYKNGDTIGLRLELKSAIISYGLFWGNASVKKDELILIDNLSMNKLAKLKIDSISEDKVLIIIDSSSYPSLVISSKAKKCFEFIGNTDGVIEIGHSGFERMNIKKQKVELRASTIFLTYNMEAQLELKHKYTLSTLLNRRKHYKLLNIPILKFRKDGDILILYGNEIYNSNLQYLHSKSLSLEEFFMLE